MPLATEYEAHLEYGRNAGADHPERAWILTPWDAWVRNPAYHGPPMPHPEDDAAWEELEFIGPRQPYVSPYPDEEIPF